MPFAVPLPVTVSFTASEKLSPFPNLVIAALVTFRLICKVTAAPEAAVILNTGLVSVAVGARVTEPPVMLAELAMYSIPVARVTST